MTVDYPAKYQHLGRLKPIRLVVLHCTVSPEMGTGAEQVARYFQHPSRPGSTHLVGDDNSVVRCVADTDTAFGAAGANSDGLHFELVGQPDQTAAQWHDTFSTAELELAAHAVAGWCEEWRIPPHWLTVAQVADGKSKGITDHATVSKAFPAVSTGHWDPGPYWPHAEFVARVSDLLNPAPLRQGDPMLIAVHGTTSKTLLITPGVAYQVGGAAERDDNTLYVGNAVYDAILADQKTHSRVVHVA